MNFLARPKSSTRTLPLVPVRDTVVFPHTELILTFARRRSTLAVNAAFQSKKLIAIFTQKQSDLENPQLKDLYSIGTLCVVERTLKNDGELNVLVRGISRIKLEDLVSKDPYWKVSVSELGIDQTNSPEIEAATRHLSSLFKKAVNLGKPVEFMSFMHLMSGVSAGELVDQVASTLSLSLQDKQHLLEMLPLKPRLERVITQLSHEVKVLELEKNIANKTQAKFNKSMKEAVLRERMETIKKELGESSSNLSEADEIKKSLKKLGLPKKSLKKALKDLSRYEDMSPNNPEANYIRTWLDTILELPWQKTTNDRVSLKSAASILNHDHYGLKKVKERILEYLSVMKLKKSRSSSKSQGVTPLPTILCFVGPPGVGKTSLGRSIAHSLKRKFVKVSLGGIRDEAEIRGHRRTYVGAMPGRIIDGIRQAESSNPVFMLDEIDKLSSDYHGDPSAALLEALDPEQNSEFSDHYLDMPYDLSRVIFIATANVLDTIPSALLDRLEIINFSSYTEIEKYHIAKNHLLPKVIEKNSLNKGEFRLSKATLMRVIRFYTREAGVRDLERQLNKIARKQARKLATSKKKLSQPTLKTLPDFLGPTRYLPTLREKSHPLGMATGLAWTSVGGDILFIEVSLMPGKGDLKITGQLGEVMQESAQAALSYVRSHYKDFGLKKDFYQKLDVHIHVPEGAVPKDGPSAGVTIATALVSALTKRKVKKTLGMTGEITLRGRVLEIGGLKEKTIAAHTAGLKEIIIPKDNQRDLVKIPQEVRDNLSFHPVSTISEVLELALL